MTFQNIASSSNPIVQTNENFQSLAGAGVYGLRQPATSGLTLGYWGGYFDGADRSDGTVAVTASNTNYIVLSKSGHAVSASTATTNWNNDTDYWRIGVATAGGSTITAYKDARFGPGGVFNGGGAGSGNAEDVAYDNATSGLTASDVQAAIDELAAGGASGDADDISYDNSGSGLSATDVQAAIDELAAGGGGGGSSDVGWYQPSQLSYYLSNSDKTAQDQWTSASTTIMATTPRNSGLHYFEVEVDAVGSSFTPMIGLGQLAMATGAQLAAAGSTAAFNTGWGVVSDGRKVSAGTLASYGPSYTTGDVIGVAVNFTTGKIWFAKNNTWMNSGDPAAGTNEAYSTVAGYCRPAVSITSGIVTGRFKTADLAYSPPSGFSAWQ